MNSQPWAEGVERLILAGVLILLNGFFVAAEIALVKLRHTQVDALVRTGSRRAQVVVWLKGNLGAVIGATQVGITLVSLLMGKYIEPMVETAVSPTLGSLGLGSARWLHQILFFGGFLAMSFILIVVGELVPKALALRRTDSVALWVAQPLRAFLWIAYPLVTFIDSAANWVLARLGVEPDSEEIGQSVDEIRWVLAGQKQEKGFELSQAIVMNSLDLRRRLVREVMRPRREITYLDLGQSLSECLALVERTRYSRYPLCRQGDLDRTVGVIHIKDIYSLRGHSRTSTELLSVARPLIYVPETARLEGLLRLFLERKLHLALVIDEYGGTTGMVTIEDILEQLVGSIQDEFDQEKPRLISKGESEWEVDGTLPLFELEEITGEPLEAPGVTTVGGWVTAFRGGFPRQGESIPVGEFELVIDRMDGNGMRVERLTLRRRTIPESVSRDHDIEKTE